VKCLLQDSILKEKSTNKKIVVVEAEARGSKLFTALLIIGIIIFLWSLILMISEGTPLMSIILGEILLLGGYGFIAFLILLMYNAALQGWKGV